MKPFRSHTQFGVSPHTQHPHRFTSGVRTLVPLRRSADTSDPLRGRSSLHQTQQLLMPPFLLISCSSKRTRFSHFPLYSFFHSLNILCNNMYLYIVLNAGLFESVSCLLWHSVQAILIFLPALFLIYPCAFSLCANRNTACMTHAVTPCVFVGGLRAGHAE